jgi:DNA-binding NarL/FixJ family response regulator
MKIEKLVLVDDHQMFRDILGEKLNNEKHFKVIKSLGSAQELWSVFPEINVKEEFPLILLDIDLPDQNGYDILKRIMEINPNHRVIILSYHDELPFKSKFIKEGARSYIAKSKSYEEILDALYSVSEKGYYYTDDVNQALMDSYLQKHRIHFHYPEASFSDREIEIIKLICSEKTAKEIASILFIEAKTVESHKARIMQKLDVKSSIGIVLYAIQSGII